jgi:hypothetical protein
MMWMMGPIMTIAGNAGKLSGQPPEWLTIGRKRGG